MSQRKGSGLGEFKKNLFSLKRGFVRSFVRGGLPRSDRSRAAVSVNNFFLHVQGARVHLNTLRPTYTLGFGLVAFFLLLITFVSGALLMIFYVPSAKEAYDSVKDINYVVFGGRLLRNMHKWAGEGMLIFVMLHMARVFYTASYKKGREFNWLVGICLLALTFVINYTGYLLPWDQLAYWALIIGSNIAQSPREVTDILGITGVFDIGGLQKELLLGGTVPTEITLARIYFLHIMLFPSLLSVLIAIHFWRIRKDGGLSVPDNFKAPPMGEIHPTSSSTKTYGLMAIIRGKTPAVDMDVENTVMSWPYLLRAELGVFMVCLTGIFAYSFFVDAPLKEIANPLIPENPAKAPWYFLGLQELVSYSAFMGGVVLPGVALLGLALVPYLDREEQNVGVWFSGAQGRKIALISLLVGSIVLIGILAFVVRFGWLRNWWPSIPQIIIILINPGNIWLGFVIAWSLFIIHRTGSTRMGAIALFTTFLLSYVILTYMGTELRGPNWGFYWSRSQWPVH